MIMCDNVYFSEQFIQKELNSKVSTDETLDRLDQCSGGPLDQCSRGPLHAGLQEGHWCSLVPELLDSADHDWREKVAGREPVQRAE